MVCRGKNSHISSCKLSKSLRCFTYISIILTLLGIFVIANEVDGNQASSSVSDSDDTDKNDEGDQVDNIVPDLIAPLEEDTIENDDGTETFSSSQPSDATDENQDSNCDL